MAKTKNTARKPQSNLPPATVLHQCPYCSTQCVRRGSLNRHILIKHGRNPDRSGATAERINRYKSYGQNTKAERQRRANRHKLTTDTEETEPVAGPSSAGTVKVITLDEEVTDTGPVRIKPGHQYEAPADYAAPDTPDTLPGTVRQSCPSTEPSVSACIRKRSNPVKPGCRKIQRRTMPTIAAIPRTTVAPSPATRRRRLTPAQLTKIVCRRPKERPVVIVDEVAERYGLNPEQKKTTVNQVIAMRAIQRRLSTEIRRQLPVRQTVTSVGEFMDRLADKLEELSTSDSTDEFV